MINVDMRLYDYFTIGEPNAYGQAQLPSEDATPEGKVKIAIYTSSQSIQDNINYQDCSYIGLTTAPLSDKNIIQYGNERLKVLYVNPRGRFKQVFLQRI
jgi:hypothetical protein